MARRNQRANAPKDPYAAITEAKYFESVSLNFLQRRSRERSRSERESLHLIRVTGLHAESSCSKLRDLRALRESFLKLRGNAQQESFSKPCVVLHELRFRRRGLSTENRVAMREAPKPFDDVAVLYRIAQRLCVVDAREQLDAP